MRVMVRLFGPEAARVGRREVTVELAGPSATAAEVLAALAEAAPELGEAKDAAGRAVPRGRLAVNHAFVAADATVGEEDEVALIGQVSGG